MALSNLANEPRREITEQAIGAASIVGFLGADYALSLYLFSTPKDGAEIALGMIIAGIALIGGLLLLTVGIHAIGEMVCDMMEEAGVDPRPKQRY